MQNIEGLYSAINAIIKGKEAENRLAVSAPEIMELVKKEVDVYSASLDWYIAQVLRSAVETVLNQLGYRSVVHGEGLFVNLDNCEKKIYLARMFNNAAMSKAEKEKVLNFIQKKIHDVGIDGQLCFDFEKGTIIEDITEEQIIAMLREDAFGAA